MTKTKSSLHLGTTFHALVADRDANNGFVIRTRKINGNKASLFIRMTLASMPMGIFLLPSGSTAAALLTQTRLSGEVTHRHLPEQYATNQ